MKLTRHRIKPFLRRPDPDIRAVLIYGPDTGLIRERAATLTAAVVEDPADPFRVAELTAKALSEEPARLGDEAAALSLTGGRRVVRLRDAGDAQTTLFKDLFDHAETGALVIAEGGDLGPRSSLRRLFERSESGAALPCYADDAGTLAELVRTSLEKEGLAVDADALAYLVQNLGGDRQVSRGELEKLALYMGARGAEGGVVSLEDATACVGDSAALGLEDVAFAAAGGDQAGLERALSRGLLAGNGPVQTLRGVARHLMRLHQASGLRDGGVSGAQAMKALRPPVFFKRQRDFEAQLGRWSTDRLARALDLILEAERNCKVTGAPQEALCGRALIRVAGASRASRRRAS